MLKTRKGRAFTLVELLVVIAIIAILAALLLPVLNRAMESSKQTGCKNNLKEMFYAMRLYSDSYDGAFPDTGNDGVEALGLLIAQRLIDDPNLFRCPSNLRVKGSDVSQIIDVATMTDARCAYGYDPGHSTEDTIAILMADAQVANLSIAKGAPMTNVKSHKGQGFNVLRADGKVFFKHDTTNDGPGGWVEASIFVDGDDFVGGGAGIKPMASQTSYISGGTTAEP